MYELIAGAPERQGADVGSAFEPQQRSSDILS